VKFFLRTKEKTPFQALCTDVYTNYAPGVFRDSHFLYKCFLFRFFRAFEVISLFTINFLRDIRRYRNVFIVIISQNHERGGTNVRYY
jgi:hypothetical protein